MRNILCAIKWVNICPGLVEVYIYMMNVKYVKYLNFKFFQRNIFFSLFLHPFFLNLSIVDELAKSIELLRFENSQAHT